MYSAEMYGYMNLLFFQQGTCEASRTGLAVWYLPGQVDV
jgi:hypothetical protein